MRIFIYEYTSAVPAAAGAASLRAEGAAMLNAVLADFRQLPNVEVFTLLDTSNERDEFQTLVGRADYTLVIAPETGGILAERCRWVSAANGRLLGATLDAVELCSDKLRLASHWQRAGVPTPETKPWQGVAGGDIIVKPRYGAGCDATFHNPARAPTCQMEMIVQPWIAGTAASVSFLIGPHVVAALVPGRQHIMEIDGRLHYAGGSLPLPSGLAARAERISRHAIAAVPGLAGYVGVDVILGDDGRDWAIEINSRLTTSYVGLRQLCRDNLMAALLSVMRNEPPNLTWDDTPISFTPDGRVARA